MRDYPKWLGQVGLWMAGGGVRLVEGGVELFAEEVLRGEVILMLD